jgi:hypothetical protein
MQLRIRFRALVATFLSIVVLAAIAAQSVFADPRDFTLINNSSVTLTSVYVSPSDAKGWEEDVMGRDVLPAGESVDIGFAKAKTGVCLFDIKVVGIAGEVGILYDIDLCSTSTVTFNDGVNTGAV